MIDCPNCHAPMTAKAEDAFAAIPRPLEVDCCSACGLFWFDDAGSIRLMPKAVLNLFQLIGQAGSAKNALGSAMRCPRCSGPLAFTHDMQRNTRFTYWRCPADHGQLFTFSQFLAEKNFVRPLSAAELDKLRRNVRQITCSQCGAPIDLSSDSACRHCGAAVSIIDSDGVAKALQDLASGRTVSGAPQDSTRAAISDAQIDALFDVERMRKQEGSDDLVAIGASAIGALIGGWLLSRVQD
jgi:hypothetical protein